MTATATTPAAFRRAVEALEALAPRPEITLRDMRPPQRLAPWSAAWTAEVVPSAVPGQNGPGQHGPAQHGLAQNRSDEPDEPDVVVTGRLVLLHDPEGQEAWDGTLRLVTFVRAELDPEHANDPMLAEVAWSWLTGALEESGADATALGGTVTQTSSVRFGDIGGPGHVTDLELRASWTPREDAPGAHGEAFLAVLATAAGLPPLGVATLNARRPR